MGESEARSITTGWRSSDSAPDPQAELRKKRELEALTMRVHGAPAQLKPKQRRHTPQTKRLYGRLREVPRNVPLEKAAGMYDHGQIPFPVPKYLRDKDWPDTWLKAWKDKEGGFRKKLSDLRQCAWQAKKPTK